MRVVVPAMILVTNRGVITRHSVRKMLFQKRLKGDSRVIGSNPRNSFTECVKPDLIVIPAVGYGLMTNGSYLAGLARRLFIRRVAVNNRLNDVLGTVLFLRILGRFESFRCDIFTGSQFTSGPYGRGLLVP